MSSPHYFESLSKEFNTAKEKLIIEPLSTVALRIVQIYNTSQWFEEDYRSRTIILQIRRTYFQFFRNMNICDTAVDVLYDSVGFLHPARLIRQKDLVHRRKLLLDSAARKLCLGGSVKDWLTAMNAVTDAAIQRNAVMNVPVRDGVTVSEAVTHADDRPAGFLGHVLIN